MSKKCGCANACGCSDVVLTTPPSCNTAPPCEGDPCAETWAAECVVYTGDTIANLNILKGDRLDDIIQRLALAIVSPGCAFNSPCGGVIGLQSTQIGTTTIKLKWNAVTAATSYQVEYLPPPYTSWLLNPAVVAPLTVDTIGGLTSNTSYYVRVNTICAAGNCYSLTLLIKTL